MKLGDAVETATRFDFSFARLLRSATFITAALVMPLTTGPALNIDAGSAAYAAGDNAGGNGGGGQNNKPMKGDLYGDVVYLLRDETGIPIVVNGCIRDSAEIKTIQVGVKALATHPMKSHKYGEGRRDVAVQFAGIKIAPGEYLYADTDGIIITSQALQATEVNP